MIPLSQLSRKDLNQDLLMCREFMPSVPLLVLLVYVPVSNKANTELASGNTEIVNGMIKNLVNAKFTV